MTDFLHDPDTGLETSVWAYMVDAAKKREAKPEDMTDNLTLAAQSLQKSIESNKEQK